MQNLNDGMKKLKKSIPRAAAVVPYSSSNADLNLSTLDKPVTPLDDASEKHIDSARPMEELQRQKEEVTRNDRNDTFLTLQDKEVISKGNSHREQ